MKNIENEKNKFFVRKLYLKNIFKEKSLFQGIICLNENFKKYFNISFLFINFFFNIIIFYSVLFYLYLLNNFLFCIH